MIPDEEDEFNNGPGIEREAHLLVRLVRKHDDRGQIA